MGLDNESRIKAIQEIHYAEITKKNSDLRDIALARKYDKKASNMVSSIDQYLTRITCSTSHLLFILFSAIYKVINQLYDERNFLNTSINQKVEEAQTIETSAQLDAVTTVHSERAVSVHKINAITAKQKNELKTIMP